MPNLLGTAPNQVPTNGDLGKLAFMDVVDTVTNNPYVDTAISDTKPSLLLDFANSKTLDPRITYTRASTATYYDGKTTAVAEQNLLLRSQEFDDGYWNKANVTVAGNNATAPDGTTTAETLTATAGTSIDVIVSRFSLSSTSGLDYVVSCFAKAGTYSAFQITNGNFQALSAHATFDLSAGTVGSSANCTASIQNVGNGWYRCVVAFSANITGGAGALYMCLAANTSASRLAKWSPVGTETIQLWGAQLEQRSSVSAYTPTTSSAITNYIPALQTAAAGVPRFDHDPVTGESKGFLIEEQRTNLFTYSEQFDNAVWSKFRSSTAANTIVAPDGTLTGDKLVEDTTATATHFIQNNTVGTVGVTETLSMYAKQGGRSWVYLQLGNSHTAYFDLANGVVGTTAGTGVIATITPVGNGWYRCSLTGARSTTQINYIMLASANGTISYTGDGYSGIYIWGAQLEAGSFATSYIPTTSAQVTRSADAASMTGGNFSSWYNQAEGTLYGEMLSSTLTTALPVASAICLIGSSANDRAWIQVDNRGTTFGIRIETNGAAQTNWTTSADVNGIVSKKALSYATNNTSAAYNGFITSVDTSCVVPNVTTLQIGSLSVPNVPYGAGTIKRIAYYPKRLSNAELQEMTQ